MSGLLEDCRKLFKSDDLYVVFGVPRNASQQQLKRGYHKLSLKVHPDRVPEKQKASATKKFQALGKVYALLSDNDKRALYDETGEVADDDDVSQEKDWYEYWRILFAKISVKDIKEFEKKYKGSKEELSDLEAAYLEFEGDMDDIMDNIMCCTAEDEPRFAGIIKDWIRSKQVPNFKTFSKESKSKKKERRDRNKEEAHEAEKAKKELGLDKEDSLRAMILKKHQSREAQANDFFAHLEQKYAALDAAEQPTKKKSKKK